MQLPHHVAHNSPGSRRIKYEGSECVYVDALPEAACGTVRVRSCGQWEPNCMAAAPAVSPLATLGKPARCLRDPQRKLGAQPRFRHTNRATATRTGPEGTLRDPGDRLLLLPHTRQREALCFPPVAMTGPAKSQHCPRQGSPSARSHCRGAPARRATGSPPPAWSSWGGCRPASMSVTTTATTAVGGAPGMKSIGPYGTLRSLCESQIMCDLGR
jgi:hypothetical protein